MAPQAGMAPLAERMASCMFLSSSDASSAHDVTSAKWGTHLCCAGEVQARGETARIKWVATSDSMYACLAQEVVCVASLASGSAALLNFIILQTSASRAVAHGTTMHLKNIHVCLS